jgi:catechol 2,3-dioxygenase-like lactoylglutathione lyase family enzyme
MPLAIDQVPDFLAGDIKLRVRALDHVNVRSRDIAASARFYVELLELEVRDPPGAMTSNHALWLCDQEGRAIIHLVQHDDDKGAPGPTGPIDHVALNCVGKRELIERLQQRGAQCDVYDLQAVGRTLVFTRDPHGILLELNFDGE